MIFNGYMLQYIGWHLAKCGWFVGGWVSIELVCGDSKTIHTKLTKAQMLCVGSIVFVGGS